MNHYRPTATQLLLVNWELESVRLTSQVTQSWFYRVDFAQQLTSVQLHQSGWTPSVHVTFAPKYFKLFFVDCRGRREKKFTKSIQHGKKSDLNTHHYTFEKNSEKMWTANQIDGNFCQLMYRMIFYFFVQFFFLLPR